jgi:hypothetical protein
VCVCVCVCVFFFCSIVVHLYPYWESV